MRDNFFSSFAVRSLAVRHARVAAARTACHTKGLEAYPLSVHSILEHFKNWISLSPFRGFISKKTKNKKKRLAALKPRPVLVSERLGVIRVSPHLYNTPDDLRCLLDGLREAVRPVSRL